jgi:hypothetical protein
MKTKITLIALLVANFVLGQNWETNFDYDMEYSVAMHQPTYLSYVNGFNNIKVEQLQYVLINKKGEKSQYVKEFNEYGKVVKYYKNDPEKGQVPLYDFEYEEGMLTQAKSYRKGKANITIKKTLNDYGRVLESTRINKRGKVVVRNTWEYNTDSCLVASTRYKRNGKVKRKWAYEYYDKHNKSRSKLYNGKGKLLNVWTYDCKQEGEKLSKKEDTTQICKWDETSLDYLFRVYQTFNEKGKIRKYVRKYTREDTAIVESTTYDENDNMLYHSTYDKSYKKPLLSEGYRKGKLRYCYKYEYDNDKIISYTYTKKGKLRSKYENKYEGDRVVEQKRFNKKGELSLTVKLKYGKSFASRIDS